MTGSLNWLCVRASCLGGYYTIIWMTRENIVRTTRPSWHIMLGSVLVQQPTSLSIQRVRRARAWSYLGIYNIVRYRSSGTKPGDRHRRE